MKLKLSAGLRAGLLSAVASVTAQTWAVSDLPDDLSLADPLLSDVPHVLSAVRLHQPTAEVPASVTVLDSDFIRATGAKNISDLLRYVPGMQVAPELYDNSESVAYHGGPSIFPKSMQVLIDGRSVYRSGLAAVGWEKLPVAVEEIQRIEVVRGPNSTSYGTNAYQAVVNIITHHPSDSGGDSLTVEGGNNSEGYVYAQKIFTTEKHQWRLNANYRHSDNMQDSTDPRLGCSDGCPDTRESAFITLRGHHDLGANDEMDSAFVIMTAERDVPLYEFSENRVSDLHMETGTRYYRQLNSNHELKVSAYALMYERYQPQSVDSAYAGYFDPDLGALYRLNPEAARQFARGEVPAAADMSDPQQASLIGTLVSRYADPADFIMPIRGELTSGSTEYRADLEVQDTLALRPDLTMIAGFGYRYDRVESENYYNGMIDDHKLRLFGNLNWHINQRWVAHSGLMLEKEDGDDYTLSARAALNYLISPLESLRLVYSQAARTPDFLEENADWTYRFRTYETESPYASDEFYASLQGPGDLEPQRIESYEIGYYGRSGQQGTLAEWDLRLFYEELTEVVYLYPSVWAEQAYCGNRINFSGAEWQLSLSPSSATTLRLSGALINASADPSDPRVSDDDLVELYSPFTQTLAWLQQWPASVHSTASLFLISDAGGVSGDDTRDVQRLDLHLYQPVSLGSLPSQWNIRIQHDFSDDTYTPRGSRYDSDTRFQAGIRLQF